MPELDDLVELQVDSDKTLFDNAMAAPEETPEATEAEPDAAEAETTEQPRDPGGRFASKAGEPPVEATADIRPIPEPDGGTIPSWRLREKSDEARALKEDRDRLASELAELRRNPPKPVAPEVPTEKPDPLFDPDGYRKAVRDEVIEMVQKRHGEQSFQAAHDADKETFEKAIAEVAPLIQGGDAAVYNRIWKALDPGKALIGWFRERENLREVGSDLTSYKQRLLDDAAKDPAFQAKVIAAIRAQQAPAAVQNGTRQPSLVRLPPSLSTVTPSGAARGSDDDDVSDQGLFENATAGMR